MTRLQKKPLNPIIEMNGGSWRSILLGSSNLELRIKLSDFNPGDINQIQDRSQ